jgi:ArsR family transcriptional regulator
MDENQQARLEQTAEMFKALGHPMRLAMLEKLKEQPWCVCDIGDSLELNKSAASKHLSQLYDVGLLSMEKKGTQVIYSLAAPCVVDLSNCSYQAAAQERKARDKR